jgi:hypothetical protein
MATKGCKRLLPLPCGPGKHRPVECLRATLAAIVAAPSTPSQSTTNVVEPDNPDLQAVDSSPTRFASLSCSPLPRHSSKVGAVCVEAPVRICAGGDRRWSSLPRPTDRRQSGSNPKPICAAHGYDINFHSVAVLDGGSLSRCAKLGSGSTRDALRAVGSSHDTI